MTESEIANVVGKISYRQELDLATLAETFENRPEITGVVYDPAENHWLQSRFVPGETYVAFYRSGGCSIAGCRSVDHLEAVGQRVNDVMGDLLELEFEPAVVVSNIVATTDLGESIHLESLMIELGMERTEYEPEQFPALIYRDSDHVLLVF